MVLTKEQVLNKLIEFESEIKRAVLLIHHKYGNTHPIALWRNGTMERIGVIDSNSKINYSFHGAGMTLEINDKILSFDLDENGSWSYDSFKFFNFLSSDNAVIADAKLVNQFLDELVKDGVLEDIKTGGLYLKN
jgi:hypothetical protein